MTTPNPVPTYPNQKLQEKYSEHLSWLMTNHQSMTSDLNHKVASNMWKLYLEIKKRNLKPILPPELRPKSTCPCYRCEKKRQLDNNSVVI